ncbi:extracellular solute-binding protein [Maritalea sp. S77]|jgi:putative aldouronate transport system substrate-binding protein|uniref:extracellular solute-binding protein n=1 Tax=Maritalea sp. S77 TaxID=3415125 RepID=UPI003C7E28EB
MLAKILRKSVAAIALSVAAFGNVAYADPVTIRVVAKDLLTTNPEDVAHIERIEKAMTAQGNEIDIEIVDLPASGYQDKLALMLLSGDIPDLIYFQGGDEQFANQGLLEDWRPYIESSENLAGAMWPHNAERLENYPYLLYVFPARTKSPVMRKDWLEMTGMDSPQNLNEWKKLLDTLSATDYDGNGKNDTHAIITPNTTAELDAVFNRAFGIEKSWLKDGDGNWISSRVSENEREKLAFYHDMFASGQLDPEFVTSNWEVKEDKFYTGRVAVVMGTSGPVVDIYRTKMRQVHPDTELALLEPPAGLQAVDVSKESRGFAMSVLSENKEMVAKLMDFLASPEGQMMERMGFEGTHYTLSNGEYATTEKIGTWYPRFMIAQPSAWTPPTDLMSPVAAASLEQGAKYFTPDNSFVWPADYAADVDAANNYYRTSVYRFVSGEWSMDQWDEYVAGWNAAGGARLTEYARTVLK